MNWLKKHWGWFPLGVFLFLYLYLFRNALVDDAFIYLSYVKTFLKSGTWGFFPGYITNTATSPLNVILLSFISLLTGSIVLSPIWLAWAGFMVITWTLTRISDHLFQEKMYGYLAASALIFNPLMISTLGLEGILIAVFFVLIIYCYLKRRWYLLGVISGLLALARPDGFVYFGLILLFIPTMKFRLRFTGIFLLCTIPWYFFSWIHLGSFIPDTFFIKTIQKSFGCYSFFNGISFLYHILPLGTVLSFLLAPLILFLLSKNARRQPVLYLSMLMGGTHFISYSVLHVPPFHWYYIPEATVIILLAVLSVGFAYQGSSQSVWKKKTIGIILLLIAAIPPTGMSYLLARDRFVIKEMPILSNWATHEQYKAVGLFLKERYKGETMLLGGEIGTLAYYSDCYLLDWFSDRRWLGYKILKKTSRPGLKSLLYKVNFEFFTIKKEYPPPTHRLIIFRQREKAKNMSGLRWETSTKPVRKGLILLSEIGEK